LAAKIRKILSGGSSRDCGSAGNWLNAVNSVIRYAQAFVMLPISSVRGLRMIGPRSDWEHSAPGVEMPALLDHLADFNQRFMASRSSPPWSPRSREYADTDGAALRTSLDAVGNQAAD
jgi:hypothetical protein